MKIVKPKLIILLDGFGQKYFKMSDFLKELAKNNHFSSVETPFGYASADDHLYSGKYPRESGVWMTYTINRKGGLYFGTKNFYWILKILIRLGFPVTTAIPYIYSKFYNISNLYKLPRNIPINVIPYLDLCVKFHPSDKRYPIPNIFSQWRTEGEKYLVFISNVVFNENGYRIHYTKMGDDTTVKNLFFDYLSEKVKLYVLHLVELDKIGHIHYTGNEVKKTIKKEEKLIEEILSKFLKKFPDGKFVIFGDHGMAPVKKAIDSSEILKFGRESDPKILYFIDSTFLRIYLKEKNIQDDITKELRESFNLFIVDRQGFGTKFS